MPCVASDQSETCMGTDFITHVQACLKAPKAESNLHTLGIQPKIWAAAMMYFHPWLIPANKKKYGYWLCLTDHTKLHVLKNVHTKRFTRNPPAFTLPAFVLIIMLQTYSANGYYRVQRILSNNFWLVQGRHGAVKNTHSLQCPALPWKQLRLVDPNSSVLLLGNEAGMYPHLSTTADHTSLLRPGMRFSDVICQFPVRKINNHQLGCMNTAALFVWPCSNKRECFGDFSVSVPAPGARACTDRLLILRKLEAVYAIGDGSLQTVLTCSAT